MFLGCFWEVVGFFVVFKRPLFFLKVFVVFGLFLGGCWFFLLFLKGFVVFEGFCCFFDCFWRFLFFLKVFVVFGLFLGGCWCFLLFLKVFVVFLIVFGGSCSF